MDVRAHHVRLAKLFARTFYQGQYPPFDWRDPEGSDCRVLGVQVDTPGLCVLLVDFISESHGCWVEESELLDKVKVNPKLIMRALAYLVGEDFVVRGETRGGTRYIAMHFPRLFDSIQLRLGRLSDSQIPETAELRKIVAALGRAGVPVPHFYSLADFLSGRAVSSEAVHLEVTIAGRGTPPASTIATADSFCLPPTWLFSAASNASNASNASATKASSSMEWYAGYTSQALLTPPPVLKMSSVEDNDLEWEDCH